MNAQQLKNSILQLAVQGKLVPQDPNDEPASELLKRIKVEKEKLIKEKKIKAEKNSSEIFKGSDNLPYEKIGNEVRCIAEEIPFDIPDSWQWVRLGSISSYAETKKKINAASAEPSLWGLDLEDIEKGGKLLEHKTVGERKAVGDKTVFAKGDILYSKLRPYLLKILIAPDNGICTPEVVPFRVYGGINPNYIVTYLKSPYVDNLINSITYGVKMPRVGTETMTSLLVPIPPLEEQRCIVEKIAEVEPIVSAYSEAYQNTELLNTSFPEQLKKSILQQAVQGKLVPQDPSDEPASVLIEQIRKEKEQLIKEKKIKKDKNESFIFRRDNSYYEKLNGKETCIDDLLPFELPESWEWCTLADVTERIHYGYTASATITGDAKLARITDIQYNRIEWSTVPYCSISKENLPKYKLKNRDILIARTGGTIGKTYIVRNLNENAVFASYLIRAIPLQSLNEVYLKLFMESPFYWEQLKAYSMGTGQPNVNGESLSKLILPLPPLKEQNRIVEKINELLPNVEKLNF